MVKSIYTVLILDISYYHRLTKNIIPTSPPFVPSLPISDVVLNEEVGAVFHLVQVPSLRIQFAVNMYASPLFMSACYCYPSCQAAEECTTMVRTRSSWCKRYSRLIWSSISSGDSCRAGLLEISKRGFSFQSRYLVSPWRKGFLLSIYLSRRTIVSVIICRRMTSLVNPGSGLHQN